MTLNILFLTVTIKKRLKTKAQTNHNEEVQKRYEENRTRMVEIQRWM